MASFPSTSMAPGRDEEAAARFCERYDPLVLDPMMRAYYGGTGFYNTGLWSGPTPDQAAASRALVDRMIEELPDDCRRIADAGCGLGATTARIAERRAGAEVVGINLSERQIARCAGPPRCRFVRMDAARMTFPDASLCAVMSVEAAFHFDTRRDFLREAFRALRPGGALVLTDILFATRAWAGAWTVPPANHVAGVEAYARALVEAGFEVRRCDDLTACTWDAWCARLAAWIDGRHRAGKLADAAHRAWTEILAGLRSGAVSAYLLVSARKPC